MTVDGKPACVYFISPVQNALVPADPDLGTVEVSVSHSTLASNNATATMQAVAPALFTLANGNAAALHANNTIVGPTTLYAKCSTPASPGETIMLFGTGFGPGNAELPERRDDHYCDSDYRHHGDGRRRYGNRGLPALVIAGM